MDLASQTVELWTEGEVAELRWFVEEGRPVAEIARRLGRSEHDVRGAIHARRLWPFSPVPPRGALRLGPDVRVCSKREGETWDDHQRHRPLCWSLMPVG